MINTLNLEYLSASELGRMIRSGEISALETIRYFEKRIEKRNPSLNAFVYTEFEYAEQEA